MSFIREKLKIGKLNVQEIKYEENNGNSPSIKMPAFSISYKLVLDIILGTLIIFPFLLYKAVERMFMKPISIKGKICLVTGAGRGLGRELCIKLANLGATIVCVDIRQEINDETVKIIKDSGGKACGYICNVAKYEEVMELAVKVQNEVGRVYLLVNNAALIMTHKAGEWLPQEVISMFNVNVISHYWTIQSFLPAMKEANDGHIVSILSISAVSGIPGFSVYGATKAAGENLLCSLRTELNSNKDNNIKLTGIYPTAFDSSADHNNLIDVKTGILEMEAVVAATIEAILYGKTCVSVPGPLYYFMQFTKFLPHVMVEKMYDILNMNINVPNQTYKESIPFNDIVNKCVETKRL
ncbi:short-chain dehydrogenase/reductase family 16C member 6-like isoform X2 [Rhodnius prolixus]|uniref:short-chain dehydrogenase/reductase family 16C member 6-like isoform X2 n=1 Tax=Rhodnius prolixus TaxID=13249 RepID=UPI003D18F321